MTNLALNEEGKKWKKYMNIAIIVIVTLFCFLYLEINAASIFTAGPQLISFVANNFMPPNFANVGAHMGAVLDTILFAVVGTYIAAIMSFILGILMSEELSPSPVVRYGVRFIVSFFRNIPVIIWASLLVFVFGIGNMVGLIALMLATVGFLSRSYAESINDIAGSKLEAMKASGASWFQLVFHGLIPEFVPAWVNWTLFSFEINIRASAILGMVGAGGIGILIQGTLNMRNFRESAALIILLVVMVLITELAVNIIRKKIAN
jgi:phosphonate transport system permease protein